jgi:HD superfamily phosphohydrolase
MEYEDRVYGTCQLSEPVILELMASQALVRLKGIDQGGYGPFWIRECNLRDYERNRFTHSVGTCLLLARYGASFEEQLAGLIHDVSHTAFSHCTEYVFNAGREERQAYQDSIHGGFVRGSEIPDILSRYGFDPEHILDDDNFPLKEKSLPDLCADRIDYTLRDAMVFGELDSAGAQDFLEQLAVQDGVWFFYTYEAARRYAELFSEMNRKYYSDFASARMFAAVSGFLKYALEKGYIDAEDLEGEDRTVVDKTAPYLESDEKLRTFLARMENRIGATDDSDDFDLPLVCKSRAVDPWFADSDSLRRVSAASAQWKTRMEKELQPKLYHVRFDK